MEGRLHEWRVGVGPERFGEGADPSRNDRKAGCRSVAAEADGVLGEDGEGAGGIERRQGAPGALPLAVGSRNEDDGPVETLHEPRGDDADQALVPGLVGEDAAAAGGV